MGVKEGAGALVLGHLKALSLRRDQSPRKGTCGRMSISYIIEKSQMGEGSGVESAGGLTPTHPLRRA